MAMNDYTKSQSTTNAGNRIVAFFNDRNDAYKAISELRDRGFTTDQIGLMVGSDRTSASGDTSAYTRSDATSGRSEAHDEGFWTKMKHFFTGEESNNEDFDYSDSVSGMNWDQHRSEFYRRGIEQGGALVSVTGSRTGEARSILEHAGGDIRESGFETSTAGMGSTRNALGRDVNASTATDVNRDRNLNADRDYRIQLRGEILRTHRERVQRGEVRLRKEVITENQTVEVPVTREELVVERVAPTNQNAPAGQIGTDQEIRVPLSEERVRVDKQPVVNEEVRVGKRAVQRNERVSDNVRHEELRVDKDGDVDVQQDATTKRKKPAA